MPRKGKRVSQLAANAEKAREAAKKSKLDQLTESACLCLVLLIILQIVLPFSVRSESTVPTDIEDPTFDPDAELETNPIIKLELFLEEWASSLDRDDKISLGLFLAYNLEYALNFTATNACEYAAMMMGKSERTIRQWRADFLASGEIPENKQGRYQRCGVLWSNEDLNSKACEYVRENANVKGQAILTSGSFCSWVNEYLLPNSCLEPGFPRKISIETARQWLHHLGFEVRSFCY